MEQAEFDDHWPRVAHDLLVSSGSVLTVSASPDPSNHDFDGEWWDVTLTLDGEPIGGFGTYFPSKAEDFIAFLADYLQQHLSQKVWGGWPMCPDHPNHPLEPDTEDGLAVWRCPAGRRIDQIGHLSQSGS
jgi:hypothetical protein